MAVALQQPESIANIIAVDNAPVDARLESDFARYIQGMKKIDEAGVTRQAEADKILEQYEKVTYLSTYLHNSLSLSRAPFFFNIFSCSREGWGEGKRTSFFFLQTQTESYP